MTRVLLAVILCCQVACAATTYYVNAARPNDTGNGLTTATAFKTIACAARTNATAGDTIIVAPGVYREGPLTLNQSGSAGNVITVRGDPRNETGFSGVYPGEVRLTGYTTNDKTDHANSALVLAGYDYWTFENLYMDSGDNKTITSTATAQHITLRRCVINSFTNYGVELLPATDTALYWTFDSCIIVTPANYGVFINAAGAPTAAELDLEVAVNNCIVISSGSGSIFVFNKAGTYPFAGVDLTQCTVIGNVCFSYGSTSANDGVIKHTFRGNLFIGVTGISTSATKTFANEDWNVFACTTARSAGETPGANSQTKYAELLDWGQSDLWFGLPKNLFRPQRYSPISGFDGSGAGAITDMLGRIRPSGGGAFWSSTNTAAGAIECHDFGQRETSLVDDGTFAVKLTGPGDHQIAVPVNAQATILHIRAAYGNLYGGVALPQVQLVANAALGVAAETETCVGATTNTYETLSFTPFTPTAKGVVFLRMLSTDTNGTGQAWFDNISRNY